MFFKPHVTLYLSLYYDILFYHQNHFIFRNISMLRLASNMSIEYNYAKYHWISKEKKIIMSKNSKKFSSRLWKYNNTWTVYK